MEMDNKKLIKMAGTGVVILLAFAWFFIEHSYVKGKEYSGVVLSKKLKVKGTKVTFDTNLKKKKCYLTIKTDDGKMKNVRVSQGSCYLYEEGMRIVKKKGKRYPEPAEPSATEKLEEVKKMMEEHKSKQ